LAEPETLCVYCRRHPIDPASRPFCSERCRMADLGRWLSEDYRVPDDSPDEGGSIPGPSDDDGERESDN
jgi:endogenous inhibitor of DNA gyrase (YacG/DUF329 family)